MPGDQDLLDLAASMTYLRGGSVYVIERRRMPEYEFPVAAIFRFAA